jgi:proteasome inhibitor subunit 1 (PI31)
LDVSSNDFTSPSFFPHDIGTPEAAPLVHGFISSNRVADLMSQFKFKIIQKLIPGLRKEGYTEVAEEPAPASGSRSGQPDPRQPTGPNPAQPRPDGPRSGPQRMPYSHIPPQNPLEIGRRDRDPFPHIPANPFAPPPLFPDSGGDGMFVGPGHPILGGRRPGGDDPLGPHMGPWGGDGFLPPMGAPPGARFDPVGPNPGRSLWGGGMPGRGNMRGPDNDEFMPPGSVSSISCFSCCICSDPLTLRVAPCTCKACPHVGRIFPRRLILEDRGLFPESCTVFLYSLLLQCTIRVRCL